MTMMILMMIIIKVIIIAIMIMMIKIILIIAVVIIINSPFKPDDFSIGFTTGSSYKLMFSSKTVIFFGTFFYKLSYYPIDAFFMSLNLLRKYK